MIPRMAVEPQAFVTLPKAPAGVFSDDYLAPLENRATNSTRVEGTARW